MCIGRKPARKWAVEHQIQVGRMFDADDMVEVSQAHMMADPESTDAAVVELIEKCAELPEDQRRVVILMITDPRGVDLRSRACYATRRAYDQMIICMGTSPLTNVVVGFTPGIANPARIHHQAAEDLGMIRSIPKATVIES